MAWGASQSRVRFADRLRSWLRHHQLSAGDSLARLFHNPVSSLLTWLVIGIAMALPAGLWVSLDNIRAISGKWDGPAQVSLFLGREISLADARLLRERIGGRTDVSTARLVSREEALQEFQQLSGLGDVLENLGENPLPHVVLVTPTAESSDREAGAATLRAELAREPGVARTVLDMAWVERLNAITQLGRRMVFIVAALLAAGVLLVVGNTIRLAIDNRSEEILVLKLVGGSDAFIRRPFIYTGLWYGLGGAVLAWATVSLALVGLREPLSALSAIYLGDFQVRGLSLVAVLGLLFLGSALGLCGAWLAVAQRLGAVQPR